MVIKVDEISEEKGLTLRHVYEEGELALLDEAARLVGPTRLELRAERDGDEVKIRGAVEAAVEAECDRCLAAVPIAVAEDFEVVYAPTTFDGNAREERELAYADLAVAAYQDGLIDVDELAREQIELALPMARLCREDCQGLCPTCRANLNEGRCACAPEPQDSRWDALRNLKKD